MLGKCLMCGEMLEEYESETCEGCGMSGGKATNNRRADIMAFCSFPSGTDNFTPHQRIMDRLSLGRGTAITRVDVQAPDHGDGWIFKVEINYDHHDDIANRVIFDRIDGNVSLADAIQEAIDRYDLPAHRDDFGVDKRRFWAIWERAEDGE